LNGWFGVYALRVSHGSWGFIFCRKGKRQAQALWADIGKVSTRYLSFTATRLVEKFQQWNF
jgi:hypothetical protein